MQYIQLFDGLSQQNVTGLLCSQKKTTTTIRHFILFGECCCVVGLFASVARVCQRQLGFLVWRVLLCCCSPTIRLLRRQLRG